MEEWVKEQLARGFADFEGTTLTGTIPVKTELLNQLIARFLAQEGRAPSPAADLRQVVRFVRSATVAAEPGVVILHFEIGV
jgi:hypothetical protein